MKKIAITFMVFALVFTVNAQIKTPQPSPSSKLEQKVGLTDVTLEYSRPGVKGRTIFGDLVPYGKLWRTGANKNAMITFSTDATVDGQTLKAGTYAIFTTPNAESWDVVFYSDSNNWGTPQEWDDSKVAAKTTVKSYPMEYSVESFTMDISNLSNKGATIAILWDKTYVAVPFEVPTDAAVVASIEKAMAGTGAGDYYSAAVYYLQEGKDIEKAKMWIDKAIEMGGDKAPFWQLRQQSLIHAKAGDKEGAIAAAKRSLAGAQEAGNDDYVKMNNDSLKEWGAM